MTHTPSLVNKNLDTGADTRPGEYWLADQTYSDLLLKLTGSKSHWENVALKQNIVHFFSNGVAIEKDDDQMRSEILTALDTLKDQ
jgi:hypothetical protein